MMKAWKTLAIWGFVLGLMPMQAGGEDKAVQASKAPQSPQSPQASKSSKKVSKSHQPKGQAHKPEGDASDIIQGDEVPETSPFLTRAAEQPALRFVGPDGQASVVDRQLVDRLIMMFFKSEGGIPKDTQEFETMYKRLYDFVVKRLFRNLLKECAARQVKIHESDNFKKIVSEFISQALREYWMNSLKDNITDAEKQEHYDLIKKKDKFVHYSVIPYQGTEEKARRVLQAAKACTKLDDFHDLFMKESMTRKNGVPSGGDSPTNMEGKGLLSNVTPQVLRDAMATTDKCSVFVVQKGAKPEKTVSLILWIETKREPTKAEAEEAVIESIRQARALKAETEVFDAITKEGAGFAAYGHDGKPYEGKLDPFADELSAGAGAAPVAIA